MITLSTSAASVLASSRVTAVRVQSWLDDQLLADDIPVQAGVEEGDRSLRVPERVTLSVPRYAGGVTWHPTGNDHPLAANGQLLRVELGVAAAGGTLEWFTRGWFVISDARPAGDLVQVEASGLLLLVEEARLVSPFQPAGTLASTLRALIEPALTVEIDAGLTDRAVPAAGLVNYDEDRLGAVLELLDAWPADAAVDPDGVLQVTPAVQSDTPVVELSTLSTVQAADGSSTRAGAFNAVVARGTAADGTQVQGVAYDADVDSPTRYGGPFNPLPVPHFFASPLLATTAQATAAASTVLARLRRAAGREHTLTAVPDPRLQPGDVAAVSTDELDAAACSIEYLRLPYLADGGAMIVRVREL